MVSISKHVQSIIEEGKRIIQIIRFGKSDVQNALESSPFGIDSHAPKGMRAIFAPTTNKKKKIILGYINNDQFAKEGEIRIFSLESDGSAGMFLHFKDDGTAEFGGSSDNLVRFNNLESGFNQLRSDFNASLLHVHAPPTGPPFPVIPPSIANISGAKIDNIKTSS